MLPLQSVVFSDNNSVMSKKMFFSGHGIENAKFNGIKISDSGEFCSYSYMNLFDISKWYYLTGIRKYTLSFEYKGKAEFRLYSRSKKTDKLIYSEVLDKKRFSQKNIDIGFNESGEKIFFDFVSISELDVKNIFYKASVKEAEKDVALALVICTYNGRKLLARNLNLIKNSRFFDKESEMYGKLFLYITDNKSRLDTKGTSNYKVFHNSNTGGAGGFTRGLNEIRKDYGDTHITHVIFMDDDVLLDIEALYRTFSLLSYISDEHSDRPIAGRMLDMDVPEVQYTAYDIWNKGYIRHIGHNKDLSKKINLDNINDRVMHDELCYPELQYKKNDAQEQGYGGWWYCCYPYGFCEKNTPLPFFLHCDDVEYGLRCDKEPIILNGIHVMHDTPEKKINPILSYYDARNTMIVNAIYGLTTDEGMLEQWKNRLAAFQTNNDTDSICMTLLAMLHFLRGSDWFLSVDPELLNKRLRHKDFPEIKILSALIKISYKASWRLVYQHAKMHIRSAVRSYHKIVRGNKSRLIEKLL